MQYTGGSAAVMKPKHMPPARQANTFKDRRPAGGASCARVMPTAQDSDIPGAQPKPSLTDAVN